MKVDGSTHRGTSTPRWDWSGVDQLITPTISDGDMARIVESLPACRSTSEEIKSKIQALGARYHRTDNYGTGPISVFSDAAQLDHSAWLDYGADP
jgi:hypothetical protein